MNQDNTQESCEIFTHHPIRKLCKECRKPLEEHPFSEEDVESIRTYLKVFSEYPEIKPHPEFAWTPPNCPVNRLNEYFKQIPEDTIPRHGSAGQKNRLKRLVYQIPLHDISLEKCRFLSPKYQEHFENLVQELQNTILKIGKVKEWTAGMPIQCPKCLLVLDPGELVVTCSENGGQAFHPACFKCFQCGELLADLIHCSDVSGVLLCLRHYNDSTQKRCHTCDELIFSNQIALAGNKFYHKEHLLCFTCDGLLDDTKGYAKNGEVHCRPCYEAQFCERCIQCRKQISPESRHVTFRDKNWHDECFTCAQCDTKLSDIPIEVAKGETFLCSECYQKDFAPKCEYCKRYFDPQSQILHYEEKIYHVLCFRCVDCLDSIGTSPFVPHKGRVYCKPCHLRNFGVRCFRCKYAITDDRALMYNKQPYHEDCFTCYGCTTNIVSRPFKTVENNWYCLSCYANIFCQRCHFCEELIVLSADEEIMYSYQDYQWHASCFICSSCSNSVVDRPFMMRGKVLICKACITENEEKGTENEEEEPDTASKRE